VKEDNLRCLLAVLIHQRNESSVNLSPAAENTDEGYSGDTVAAISIIFVILNAIFITLRCYAHSLTKAVYGWDDYLIFASFISDTALSVMLIRMLLPPPFFKMESRVELTE
jgi:hypothetical protein